MNSDLFSNLTTFKKKNNFTLCHCKHFSEKVSALKKLDRTDIKILELLQQDAKLTHKQIAAQLHLTTTPIYERIKRLERAGFIRKYTALLDRNLVNLQLMAFCNVTLKEHQTDFIHRFERDVRQLPEVVECYHVAGLYDYLLKVIVPDMQTYQHFVADKLAALENIGKVQSSFVMTEIKEDTALPLHSLEKT